MNNLIRCRFPISNGSTFTRLKQSSVSRIHPSDEMLAKPVRYLAPRWPRPLGSKLPVPLAGEPQ
ncbi:MAG: hypothetical protein H6649_13270 [Caldilineae bacterium]|nr:hypothetical protein [Caldilineae bacterium]